MTTTASRNQTITLELTSAQVTQLLTAVHVRAAQAEQRIRNPRFAECDLLNQVELRKQAQIADQLVLLVENALR